MSDDIELGIRLKYDGSAVESGLVVSSENLRKVGAAAEQANQRVEISAKQAAFAMRQLPMQMTDIAVGLASGQSPFMVLMQQGGQLKDTFGGIAPAVRAVGGYVAALVNPFTIAAAAVGGLGAAYLMGQREAEGYARAIILTGNAAGATVGQLQAAAAQTARMANDTVGHAAEAITALVGTGKVAANNLGTVAEAALRLERAGVQSLDVTIKQFEALGQKPVEASLKLNDQTNYLTADLYKQIKALEDQGRASDAAALAQGAYAEAMAKRTGEIEQNLGTLERKWLAVRHAAGLAIDMVLGLGAKKGIDDQIAVAEAALRTAQAGFKGKDNIPALEKSLENLRLDKIFADSAAAAKRELNEQEQARIQFAQDGDRYLSREAQMEREIARAIEVGNQARLSEGEVLNRVNAIIDKYSEKKASAANKVDNGFDDAGRKQGEEYGKLYEAGLKYVEMLNLQLAADHKLTEGEKILGIAKKDLRDEQYKEVEALLKGAVAREQAERAAELQAKATAESNNALRGEIDSLTLHNQEIGLTEKKLNALILARMDNAIALADEKYRTTELTDANTDYVSGLADQMRLLRQRRDLVAAGQGLQAAATKTKEIERAQADMWQSIDRTAHDVWVDVSNNGVSAFERIGKTIQASVLDLLYQITIKRWLINLAVGVGGESVAVSAFGQGAVNSAMAGAAGGFSLGGAGNYLSGANTLYNAYTGGTTSMLASGIGYVGSALGSTTMTGFAAGMKGSSLAAGLAGPTTAGAGGAMGAGAAFASAVPYIAAAVALLSMVNWGGGTPHQGAVVMAGENGADSPRTREALMAYYRNPADFNQFDEKDFTKRWQAATASALTPMAKGYAELFNKITREYGAGGGFTVGMGFSADGDSKSRGRFSVIDAAGRELTDFLKRFSSDSSKGMEQFGEEAMRGLLRGLRGIDLGDEINGWLDASLRGGADLIDQLSKEQADAMLGLLSGGQMDDFIRRLGLVGASFESVNTALARSGAGFLALEQMITQLGEGIHTALASSRQAIELGGLTKAETYDYYDRQAQKANDLLGIAATAEDVGKYVGQLNEAIMAGWNSLDGDQQRAQREEFLARLDAVEERAASRNEAIRDTWAESQKAAGQAVAAAIDPAAQTMSSAAQAMLAAASAMQVAAATPQVVQLAGAGGTEVGGW